MQYYLVYAKLKEEKRYRAMDINEGNQVGNLIYATMLNTEEVGRILPELKQENPHCDFQARKTG